MMRLFSYLLLFGVILYFLWIWGRRQEQIGSMTNRPGKKVKFRAKRNPNENWVQVYETSSMDDARLIQARLEEEEVDCILYEQGKRDIHGNELKGVGIAVPKSVVPRSQQIISRLPV